MKWSRWLFSLLALALAAAIGWQVYARLEALHQGGGKERRQARAVPVLAAPIERAPIALERTFSGTLEAHEEFFAAPKVGGIVRRLAVNLGDRVSRGQVIAELDNAEFVQAVAQAEAELEVARANLAEADSLLQIAERELDRIDRLSARGVSSASQRDAAQADQLARQAHLQVTRAQLARAEAQLETARIRMGYTRVSADWHGDDERRTVADRLVDEGETVTANTPLLKIVRLDPINAVFHVTEKDYGGLSTGQQVTLVTDAFPDSEFSGVIERIAPVFREATRQARVEVRVDNPQRQLKPGMFARATVVLERVAEATVVPAAALIRRDGEDGVFVLSEDGAAVAWRPVRPGIRQGERTQVSGEGLNGRVVVLGQQMLKDGSAVFIAERQSRPQP